MNRLLTMQAARGGIQRVGAFLSILSRSLSSSSSSSSTSIGRGADVTGDGALYNENEVMVMVVDFSVWKSGAL